MANAEHVTNWSEFAIDLNDRLSGGNAEITYKFDCLHVKMPIGIESETEWMLTGTLKIRARDLVSAANGS